MILGQNSKCRRYNTLRIQRSYIITQLTIFIKQFQIMLASSNIQQSNASLHSCSGLIKDGSKKQFVRFPFSSTPGIKKQTSIEQLNQFQDKNHKFSFYEPMRLASNYSEKSLSGLKTPRRVPFTPRKQRHSNTKKLKLPDPSPFSHLMLHLKVMIKELEKLIWYIKNELDQTIQQVTTEIQQELTIFVEHLVDKAQSQPGQLILAQARKKDDDPDYNSKRKCEINRQLQLDDGKVQAANQKTSQDLPKVEAKQSGDGNEQKVPGRGNIFSNMIHIRQKLRKDATESIVAKYEKDTTARPIQMGDSQVKMRRKGDVASPDKKEMARSIEKLQKQLRSLKSILNE